MSHATDRNVSCNELYSRKPSWVDERSEVSSSGKPAAQTNALMGVNKLCNKFFWEGAFVLSCGVFCFFCKLTIDVWPAVSFWLRLLAFSWWWLKKNIMRELLCTRNRALKRLWKCTGWWFFQLQKLCSVIHFMFKNLFILVNYYFFALFLFRKLGGKNGCFFKLH